MRSMKMPSLVVFFILIGICFVASIFFTSRALGGFYLGDFRGIALCFAFIAIFYCFAIFSFRIFGLFAPLREGEIAIGSKDEFVYHVYLLYYLMIFNPVMFSGIVPIPLMRFFYQLLGARMGVNSFSVGVIMDPQFVRIGSNSIIGNGALLIPHVIEGDRLAHYPIVIGNNVTIGAHSIVLADVEIGDGAIIAVNAVVSKGARIPAGETWGGTPAKRLNYE